MERIPQQYMTFLLKTFYAKIDARKVIYLLKTIPHTSKPHPSPLFPRLQVNHEKIYLGVYKLKQERFPFPSLRLDPFLSDT